jgi:3-hydroxyisobutyrate dehydrogenase-like beta-hydroxyacid dehydrogenase
VKDGEARTDILHKAHVEIAQTWKLWNKEKKMSDSVNTLGFIGLGVMGSRMCRNLARKSGKPVVGFDLNTARAAEIAEFGIEIVANPAEVAARADIVFLCLPGEPQVRDLCFGDDALVHNMRGGTTLVDMTTATVAINREVAAALASKAVAFADAPVARGVPSAEDGTLAITVGASDEVLAHIDPYLRCMGTDISHCGDVGTGQVLKLMNNMLIFQTVSALSEAMAIATRAGVDRTKVFDILSHGSADSFALRRHGSFMTSGDYPDDWFPIDYSVKDLGYALSLAEEFKVDAEVAKVAMQRLQSAQTQGWGHLYSPAIYKLFEE